MSISSHYRNQEEISSFQYYIDKLERFNNLLNLPEKSNELKRLSDTIISSDYIDVAVVGQFKAGKSSFINSLLDAAIIPTGFLPVTSVITRVRYGDQIEIALQYQNGTKESVPPAKLLEFCSEQFNPGNRKMIEVIDVYHPALKEVSNIRLIDTPGLGSISEETTLVTTKWLIEASFALLIISSERPLSSADLMVVEQLKKICPRIFLVITKIDLIPQTEHSSLLEYIRNGIASYSTDYPITILGYSIYNNSTDYKDFVLRKILKPMQDQFDDEKISVSAYKLINLSQECLQYSEIVLSNHEKFKNDEKLLLGVIMESERNKEHYKTELLFTTTAFKGEVRGILEKTILHEQNTIIRSLFSSFDSEFHSQKGMMYKVTQWFEKWIVDGLKEEIRKTTPETTSSIDSFLMDKAGFYSLFIKTFQQSYKQFIKDLYNVDILIDPVKVSPVPIGKPDISIYRIFDSHLDVLLFFLPVFLIKYFLRKYFKKQIEYEVEKNLRRHISILTEKIMKILDTYHKTTAQATQNEFITLERLVRPKTGIEKPYLEMKQDLREMICKLQNLKPD